jgi:diguanylate cyclase (GGDEF)-like protein
MLFFKNKPYKKTEDIINNFFENLKYEKIEHSKGINGIITVSIGLFSRVPDKYDSLKNYMKTADQLLYEAKKSGRNKIIFKKS